MTKRGFTLIELLAAGVLSSLLLLAVGSLLRSSFEETAALRRTRERYPSTQLLARQLRLDFQNARGLQGAAGDVRLHGYIGSDSKTGQPTHQLALVRYFVRESILYREESTGNGLQENQPQPIWNGAGQLTVLATSDDQITIQNTNLSRGGMPPIPSTITLRLTADNGMLVLQETIFHHRMP